MTVIAHSDLRWCYLDRTRGKASASKLLYLFLSSKSIPYVEQIDNKKLMRVLRRKMSDSKKSSALSGSISDSLDSTLSTQTLARIHILIHLIF